jgi:hypothetical protein
VTPEVVFGLTPATLLVTEKITVQLLLGGIVMPVKLEAVVPATKVAGVVPTQFPVTLPPTALILVKVSENEAPVRGVALLLKSVKVTVDCPPAVIDGEPKTLLMVGGAMTVNVAVAAVPALLFVVVTVLVVFIFTPAVAPVTVTLKTQFAAPANDGLVNEMTFAVIE